MHRVPAMMALLVSGLAGAELASRVDDFFRYGIPLAAAPDHNRDLVVNDSLGPRGRPNGRHRHWVLNRWGFRGPDMDSLPRRGCRRVMVLGASEAFGYYETPGREFPAQLTDSLRGEVCWEVVNGAIAGLSLPGMINLWERWASRFRPDIVLIYAAPTFYLSDVPPSLAFHSGRDAGTDRRWWRSRLWFRTKEAFEYPAFVQRRRVERSLRLALAGKPKGWVFESVPPDRLRLFEDHLARLVHAIAASGSRPVLLTHAMRFADPPPASENDMLRAWRQFNPRASEMAMLDFERGAAAAVRRFGSQQGVEVVDIAALLSGRAALFGDFVHFTDQGSAIVAGLLAKALREGPEGTRSGAH